MIRVNASHNLLEFRWIDFGNPVRLRKLSNSCIPRVTLEDLRLMRASVSPAVKVKAAHGVRTLDGLLAVREAGAARTGATQTAAMLDDYLERTSS